MKKLILSAAIAAITASSTASAAVTVFENDDLKLNIQGEYQVQAWKKIGDDTDFDVDYDDLEIGFGAEYDLGNDMTAFGNLVLDFKKQADSIGDANDDVDEAYVGLRKGAFSGSIGQQYWGSDNFGTEKAVEMDGGYAFSTTGGEDTLKFAYDSGKTLAVFSYDMDESGLDDEAYDLFVATKVGPAEVAAMYQYYKEDGTKDSVDTAGIQASGTFGKTYVGIDYTTNDDVDVVNGTVQYAIAPKTKVAVGLSNAAYDAANTDDVASWYANAIYSFNSKVDVFAEIGDNDKDDTDVGFLTGMKLKF